MADLIQTVVTPPQKIHGQVTPEALDKWREEVSRRFNSRWVDINLDLTTATPGASAPDLTTLFGSGSIEGAAFAYNITEAVSGAFEVPHGLVLNQLAYAHCHFMPVSNAAGEAVFKLDYRWLNMNESASDEVTISSGIVDMPEEAWYPNFAIIGSMDGTGKKIGSQIACRFYRDHDDGEITAAYADDIVVLSAGFHFPVVDYGSIQIAGSG